MTEATPTTPMHGSRSIWTSRAIDALKSGKPGDKIDRQQMERLVGLPCHPQSRGYSSVNSAIKTVRRQFGLGWLWSRSEKAWVCLDASGNYRAAKAKTAEASRKVRTAQQFQAITDRSKLDDQERGDFDRNMIQVEMARLSMSSPMAKRLEQTGAVKPPDLDKLASLMAPAK